VCTSLECECAACVRGANKETCSKWWFTNLTVEAGFASLFTRMSTVWMITDGVVVSSYGILTEWLFEREQGDLTEVMRELWGGGG
jgi:hypothetical protein